MCWTHLFTRQNERRSQKPQTSLTPSLPFATCSLSTLLFLRPSFPNINTSKARQPSTLQVSRPLPSSANTHKMPPKGSVSHLLHFSQPLGSMRRRASGTQESSSLLYLSILPTQYFKQCVLVPGAIVSTFHCCLTASGLYELASRVHKLLPLPPCLSPELVTRVDANSHTGHTRSLWTGMSLTFLFAFRCCSSATPSPLSTCRVDVRSLIGHTISLWTRMSLTPTSAFLCCLPTAHAHPG